MNEEKIILDLCGGTGSWSEPYKKAGFDVRVITLPENNVCTYEPPTEPIFGILAAPPCTKFSRACWQTPREKRDFVEGMKCVRACMNIIWKIQERGAQLKFWALENPDGYLTRFLGYPVFSFQPWMFGETDFRATKRTMLWGYFKAPKKTVLKRSVPFVSPHSRPAGDGNLDSELVNRNWAKASTEDRAKTSSYFAEAFFKANSEDEIEDAPKTLLTTNGSPAPDLQSVAQICPRCDSSGANEAFSGNMCTCSLCGGSGKLRAT